MYKVLTFLIMILSKWRKSVARGGYMRMVKNSPLIKDKIPFRELERNGVLVKCCDCGLEHRFLKDEEELKAQPLRPIDYDYSWRLK